MLISTCFSFAEKQNTVEYAVPDHSIILSFEPNDMIGDKEENIIPDQTMVPFSGAEELTDDYLCCDDDDDADVIYQKCECKIKVKRSCYFLSKFELFSVSSFAVRNNSSLYSKTDFRIIPFVYTNHAKRILVLRI